MACGEKPCEELSRKECAANPECMNIDAKDPCTGAWVYGGCMSEGAMTPFGGCGVVPLQFGDECLLYGGCTHPDFESCTSPCFDTATYGW